ncbi:hypothetical protein [Haloferula sp. A504]|uniref:hypothetical protein n=1 Tax=Haloferula sp. A504 TaxID=3373601 RepID=UPI0031BD63B3|nr:hypothetical protein [Verrucomicrobiaceae bacterium E54]
MKNRWMPVVGVLLMVAGLVLFWRDGRIFSTFLLEIVVGTIGPGPAGEVPAHEFSWGVKSFGNVNAQMARAAIGALAMSVAFGPLTGVLSGKGTPAVLADQIQGAILLIGFAGGSLFLAGVLGIVAASLRAGRPEEGRLPSSG